MNDAPGDPDDPDIPDIPDDPDDEPGAASDATRDDHTGVIDKRRFAPGTLVDHGGGHYSLIYSDFPGFDELFETRGLQGGGYTWHGMVVHLLEEHAPDALDALDFDCEASMFCAVSDSLWALEKVALMLRSLETRDVVRNILENVDLREYD